MTWVRRTADRHRCRVPYRGLVPDGEFGDLWRCDDCNTLWRITLSHNWRRALWWQRILNRGKGSGR
jgi:hypothetical protein